MYLLGIIGDGRVEAAKIFKVLSLCADFLFQLTSAADFGLLAVFEFTCGNFGEDGIERISELFDHEDIFVLIESDYAYSAGVMYHLTGSFIAVIKLDLIAEQLDDNAVIDLFRGYLSFLRVHLLPRFPPQFRRFLLRL